MHFQQSRWPLPRPLPTRRQLERLSEQLNHVTLFVQDVQKSVAFYQSLFGMPVLTPQGPGINLKAGSGLLGIYPAQGGAVGINHTCLGLDKFDADVTLTRLRDRGLDANVRLRGDTKELYFTNPNVNSLYSCRTFATGAEWAHWAIEIPSNSSRLLGAANATRSMRPTSAGGASSTRQRPGRTAPARYRTRR